MSVRSATSPLVMLFLVIVCAATAYADTNVKPGHNGFETYGETRYGQSDSGTGTTSDSGTPTIYREHESCSLGSSVACYRFAQCPDGQKEISYTVTDATTGLPLSKGTYCPNDSNPAAPRITGQMVAAAFRRIPLPASELTIQPPGGKTLVNFDTNFFTDSATTLDRTVRLLGRRVDLRITAVTYTWHFGGGATRSTDDPGAAYPALTITHNYLQTGRYRPSVDTTYSADFRINGGPWRPVDGTVTITGTRQQLRAIEARPVLVNYEN